MFKLYSQPNNYKANKALIAAKYNGIEIQTPDFKVGKDNKAPAFQEKNPVGKVPVLETEQGCIFESNAIARYIARLRRDTGLYGQNFLESGLVDSWIDFCTHELEVPICTWIYPILGIFDEVPEATERARDDVNAGLKIINEHLLCNTYMVGHQITLADIALVCALTDAFKMVFDPAFRKPYPNIIRWFETCANQPEFKAVLGEIKFCDKAQSAAPGKGGKPQQQQGKKNKQEKKQEKKAASPKQKPKPAPKVDEEEAPKPKKGDPLADLPPSKMVLDEWKRTYSNTDDLRGEAMKWFWENYDPEGYCLYLCDYQKVEGECEVSFMTSNQLSGFLQRCDKCRKYAFGVMDVVGEEKNYDIRGAWLFRGTDMNPDMKEHPSYEYHTWTKVDPSNAAQKKLLEDWWCSDRGETVDGRKVSDSKCFK